MPAVVRRQAMGPKMKSVRRAALSGFVQNHNRVGRSRFLAGESGLDSQWSAIAFRSLSNGRIPSVPMSPSYCVQKERKATRVTTPIRRGKSQLLKKHLKSKNPYSPNYRQKKQPKQAKNRVTFFQKTKRKKGSLPLSLVYNMKLSLRAPGLNPRKMIR